MPAMNEHGEQNVISKRRDSWMLPLIKALALMGIFRIIFSGLLAKWLDRKSVV